MSQSHAGRTAWPSPWMVALAALGLFWFAYGLYSSQDRNIDDPSLWWPFVKAGLLLVAGYGLVAGGLIGRVLAALVALVGAAPVVAITLILMIWAATDPHGGDFSLTGDALVGFPTWLFIILVVAVVAGYGLVLVRAIRGH